MCKDILDFSLVYDMLVVSTFFRKGLSRLVTFSSAKRSNQVIFFVTRRVDKHVVLDYKVILGECVILQHKLVVVNVHFHARVL